MAGTMYPTIKQTINQCATELMQQNCTIREPCDVVI